MIVVDNASRDGTREMVNVQFPTVEYIENKDNLGPAVALNQGLAAALPWADYVLIANNDIVVHRGSLGKMLEFLRRNPDISGCCARLLNPDGTPQYTRTHIMRLLPRDPAKSGPATFPGNGFALYRSKVFKWIGGYDETFFFFNEDLEWAERAKRAGFHFYYLADVTVTHWGGAGEMHARPASMWICFGATYTIFDATTLFLPPSSSMASL